MKASGGSAVAFAEWGPCPPKRATVWKSRQQDGPDLGDGSSPPDFGLAFLGIGRSSRVQAGQKCAGEPGGNQGSVAGQARRICLLP